VLAFKKGKIREVFLGMKHDKGKKRTNQKRKRIEKEVGTSKKNQPYVGMKHDIEGGLGKKRGLHPSTMEDVSV
jgi:hypothetical protein